MSCYSLGMPMTPYLSKMLGYSPQAWLAVQLSMQRPYIACVGQNDDAACSKLSADPSLASVACHFIIRWYAQDRCRGCDRWTSRQYYGQDPRGYRCAATKARAQSDLMCVEGIPTLRTCSRTLHLTTTNLVYSTPDFTAITWPAATH